MKSIAALILASTLLVPLPCSAVTPTPETLVSTPQDRRDIEALLATYTRAVSTKDSAQQRHPAFLRR